MQNKLLRIHRPQLPAWPVLPDAPHSGLSMPAAIGAALPAADLREGQDCFIDELWMPATARGIPWPAAQFARTAWTATAMPATSTRTSWTRPGATG